MEFVHLATDIENVRTLPVESELTSMHAIFTMVFQNYFIEFCLHFVEFTRVSAVQ